jgi:hypothetical protein
MTDTDTELEASTEHHPATVTPLLDRAGVTGFISAPMPIVGEDEDFVKAGEDVARTTYDLIVATLADLRLQRDDLNAEINRLVEAEAVWAPIVRRLDTGVRHRNRVASDTDQSTLLD